MQVSKKQTSTALPHQHKKTYRHTNTRAPTGTRTGVYAQAHKSKPKMTHFSFSRSRSHSRSRTRTVFWGSRVLVFWWLKTGWLCSLTQHVAPRSHGKTSHTVSPTTDTENRRSSCTRGQLVKEHAANSSDWVLLLLPILSRIRTCMCTVVQVREDVFLARVWPQHLKHRGRGWMLKTLHEQCHSVVQIPNHCVRTCICSTCPCRSMWPDISESAGENLHACMYVLFWPVY